MTTIWINNEIKQDLLKRKQHPRETYVDVLHRILQIDELTKT